MASPTELANDALNRGAVLRTEFDLFRDDIADLSQLVLAWVKK